MTKLLKCNCKSDQQDKMHGKGLRVHNSRNKKNGQPSGEFRCTVCATVKIE